MNHWIWSISAATIPKWIAINKISKQILSRWFTADLTLPQNLELDTSHRPFRQLYRCNKLLLRTVPLQHCAAMAGHPFIVKWRGETVTENAWKGGCYWRISLGLFLGWWGGLWICLSNVVNLKIHKGARPRPVEEWLENIFAVFLVFACGEWIRLRFVLKHFIGNDQVRIRKYISPHCLLTSVSGILFVQRRRVVSWGDDYCGGDSSCVQDQLQGIKEPNLGRERGMTQSYNQRNTYPSYLMTIPQRSPKV